MFNKEQFIEDIKAMTVLELADLVKALEEEFGVSAAATAVAVAGPAAAKEVVDNAPKAVKEGVSKEDAEKIAAAFKEVGATCEIK